ncbi:hypothetical protein BJF85_15485 [Saccharomonospora sp. CUA-673]|nr:hypothetical protein [Saccharomonospora sp. CUA-673]OLT47572.1 hypothetical protein BJF85_15485 [Saccharomonospora sp. CUA-673]
MQRRDAAQFVESARVVRLAELGDPPPSERMCVEVEQVERCRGADDAGTQLGCTEGATGRQHTAVGRTGQHELIRPRVAGVDEAPGDARQVVDAAPLVPAAPGVPPRPAALTAAAHLGDGVVPAVFGPGRHGRFEHRQVRHAESAVAGQDQRRRPGDVVRGGDRDVDTGPVVGGDRVPPGHRRPAVVDATLVNAGVIGPEVVGGRDPRRHRRRLDEHVDPAAVGTHLGRHRRRSPVGDGTFVEHVTVGDPQEHAAALTHGGGVDVSVGDGEGRDRHVGVLPGPPVDTAARVDDVECGAVVDEHVGAEVEDPDDGPERGDAGTGDAVDEPGHRPCPVGHGTRLGHEPVRSGREQPQPRGVRVTGRFGGHDLSTVDVEGDDPPRLTGDEFHDVRTRVPCHRVVPAPDVRIGPDAADGTRRGSVRVDDREDRALVRAIGQLDRDVPAVRGDRHAQDVPVRFEDDLAAAGPIDATP